MYSVVFRLLVLGVILFSDVLGHGRMVEPPSRGTMWRRGFDTPKNYDDHQTYCGGLSELKKNNGKCGVCGDAWSVRPRPHEAGGKFAKDIVVQSYPKGGVIPIEIDVRANHGGYFEFRVCPAPSQRGVEVTEECLDKHVLVGENGKTRYHLGPGNRIFKMNYKLPANMTCARCVLQWKWIASHNPDRCNGEERVGCASQEQYRACADIAIGQNKVPPYRRPAIRT